MEIKNRKRERKLKRIRGFRENWVWVLVMVWIELIFLRYYCCDPEFLVYDPNFEVMCLILRLEFKMFRL